VQQTWLLGSRSNPLSDMMPTVKVTRREGVNMAAYRRLLSRDGNAVMPRSSVVYELQPDETAPTRFEAMPLILGPQGECIAVRRLVGHGAVTVVGLDLANPALTESRALRADMIWHRLLGRRYVLERPEELRQQLQNLKVYAGIRQPAPMDDSIAVTISQSGKAATGLLLGIAVFGTYWLVAGVGTYVFLSQRGLKQHSWLAFVAAIVLFTAISWGGASLFRQRRFSCQATANRPSRPSPNPAHRGGRPSRRGRRPAAQPREHSPMRAGTSSTLASQMR
jgi:hypothetical protein